MSGAKSKNKGKIYERDVANFLSELYKEPFTRVPYSGAFIGGQNIKRIDSLKTKGLEQLEIYLRIMKNKLEYYLKIIDQIENNRKVNNKNWMDLLRLSFEINPNKTSKIVSKIFQVDKKISDLAKKLTK